MELIKFVKTMVNQYLEENRKPVSIDTLPNNLYHVTTNYKKVIASGVLLAKSGLDSGGLGGTESFGVSFVSDSNIAENIYNELELINDINNTTNEEELFKVINSISDSSRKDFILSEYERTISLYKRPQYTILMALRLTRNSYKFSGKPYHRLLIFHEENIKNKDIGIIQIDKNQLSKDIEVIEGVDIDFGEIRVLGNVYL